MFKKIWYPDEVTRAMIYVPASIIIAPTLLLSFFVPFALDVFLFLIFCFMAIGGIVRVRAAMTMSLEDEIEEGKATSNKSFKKLARVLTVAGILVPIASYFIFTGDSFAIVFITGITLSTIMLGFSGYSIRITIGSFAVLVSIVFLVASSESLRLGLIFSGIILVMGLPICLEQAVKTHRIHAGDMEQKKAPVEPPP